MKQGEVGWSETRRQASRTLAFFLEGQDVEWKSVREAVVIVSEMLGIESVKRRRSAISVECHSRLVEMGFAPPPDYVAPWLRGNAVPQFQPRRPTQDRVRAFYDSFEWKRLRFEILRHRGRRCECCGSDSKNTVIHVDHIKPIKRYWNFRLDAENMQVLCEACNFGKGSKYETDFRKIA